MDIRMPGLDGIEATRKIAADPALGAVHVIILTTFELDEYIFDALRSGAAGFLVKDTDAAELIRAVRTVAGGRGAAVPRGDPAADRRVRRPHQRGPAGAAAWKTSPTGNARCWPSSRQGLSNEEIAGQIYVSPSTVKTHAARAMMKLGARDRAQLVVFAYEAGAGPAGLGLARRTGAGSLGGAVRACGRRRPTDPWGWPLRAGCPAAIR